MMESNNYQTASTTLSLLEERLRRVSYILRGDNNPAQTTPPSNETESTERTLSATERLRKLERNLASLTSKSPTASSILDLQKHHPSLFTPTPSPSTPSLPGPALAALILAHANLYQHSSTQLQTLSSQNTIPNPAVLARLIALQPRLERIGAKQDAQAREFSELRARSARVVERWYEEGVLGMGEKWAEWEERLREGEILVRRREGRERREREGVA